MDPFYYFLFVVAIISQAQAAPKGSRLREGSQSGFSCSPCPVGYGVKTLCSLATDTTCEPCGHGFHSARVSSSEPCHPCSLCGEDLYELHPCNATNDVFCELCAWGEAKDNKDFLKTCVSPKKADLWEQFKTDQKGEMLNDSPAVVEEINDGGEPEIDLYEPDSGIEVKTNSKVEFTTLKYDQIDDDLGSGAVDTGIVKGQNEIVKLPGNKTDTFISDTTSDDSLVVDADQTLAVTVSEQEGEDGSGEISGVKLIEFTIRLDASTTSPTKERSSTSQSSKTDPAIKEITRARTVSPTVKVITLTQKDHSRSTTSKPKVLVVQKEPTEAAASDAPVDVFAEVPGGSNEVPNTGAVQDSGTAPLPLVLTIVTAGIIFFALGFMFNRYHKGQNKHQVFTPETSVRMKPMYSLTRTEPPADEDDYKPPVKKPPTPEIIYTHHDEPDLGMGRPAQPEVTIPPPPATKPPVVRKPMPPIGKYQSPVDIDPEDAQLSDDLEKSSLVFKYVPENSKSLTNLGNTVKVMVDCRGSDLHGGPLGDNRFCLDHFRFHWGADDTRGSEHSLAGKRYAAEIQLVHWNKEEFRTYAEASRYESGLAAISVFMEVSEEHHNNLQSLLDVFKSIKYKGQSVEVPHHYFDPATLLPANMAEYWTYCGSLTEPPYNETVTWIVMKEPIKVSASQMAKFRELMKCERDEEFDTTDDLHIVDNFREQSGLGDRNLRASFH